MNQNIQKKPPPKQINTIDEKHTELLNLFHENETETIPRLIAEKERLKAIIPTLQDHQIDAYMEIRDKILDIKSKIKELKQEKKKYLLDNSKYIFNYFEEKKKISSGDNNQNVKILNSFFKIKGKSDETSDLNSEKYSQSKKIFQNYWRNVNNEVIHIQDYLIPSDVCEECRKGELIPQ
jgi:predicted nuclease with TOPRIM domain